MIDFKIPAGLEERLQNKNIYIWGAWEVGELLLELLRKANLNFCAYLDGRALEDSYHGFPIIKSDRLSDISSEENSVILVASVEHASIRKALNAAGFVDGVNMYYLGAAVEISGGITYYEDICGNVMHSMSALPFFSVGMFGHIRVGRNVSIGSNVKLIAWGGSTLEIGDNVKIGDNCVLISRDRGHVSIGNGCVIGEGVRLKVHKDGKIKIGNNNTVNDYCNFICHKSDISIGSGNLINYNSDIQLFSESSLQIGDDCIVSYNVEFCGTGHTIYDLNKKDVHPVNRHITVNDHVWIGFGTSLLGGAVIGRDTIVAAGSIVSKEYGSRMIIAGCPAKVIRENINWDIESKLSYEKWMQKRGREI